MIVRRGILACAALALGILAAPLAAQQAPTDLAAAATSPQPEPAPPPFPPMPRRAPSHRWVDVGGHASTTSHHRTTHSRAPTHRKQHHAVDAAARDLRFCHHLSAHKLKHNSRCQALLRDERRSADHRKQSAKDLRFCHHLSAHKLKHNSRCQALLRDEHRAAKDRKSAKDLRFCHHLSARKLKHNSRCQALLRDESRAAERRKNHRHTKAKSDRRVRHGHSTH